MNSHSYFPYQHKTTGCVADWTTNEGFCFYYLLTTHNDKIWTNENKQRSKNDTLYKSTLLKRNSKT